MRMTQEANTEKLLLVMPIDENIMLRNTIEVSGREIVRVYILSKQSVNTLELGSVH